MTGPGNHINSRFRKKRKLDTDKNNHLKGSDSFKLSFDRIKSPLIAFAILFIFMGLWILIKPHVDDDSVDAGAAVETIDAKPAGAWDQVVDVSLAQTELYRAMHSVRLRNPGAAFSLDIPRNHKGEPLITGAALVDADSLTILWNYRGTVQGQIASMTKMMLILVAYVYADSGFISFDDTVCVTDEAPLMGGSQCYLDRGQRYLVRDLIRAVTIQSANDAAYLLAQYLGDDDLSQTVKLMNEFAERLGLKKTHFYNVHGLPPANPKSVKKVAEGIGIQRYKGRDMYVATKANVSTPLEMAKLGIAIIRLPELHKWSSIRYDTLWDVDRARHDGKWSMHNHFKIVGQDSIDGIKTGYTFEAGFCVTASAKQRGRRLVAVVFGSKYQNTRDHFIKEMFAKGYEYIAEREFPADSLLDSTKITQ